MRLSGIGPLCDVNAKTYSHCFHCFEVHSEWTLPIHETTQGRRFPQRQLMWILQFQVPVGHQHDSLQHPRFFLGMTANQACLLQVQQRRRILLVRQTQRDQECNLPRKTRWHRARPTAPRRVLRPPLSAPSHVGLARISSHTDLPHLRCRLFRRSTVVGSAPF